jgi:nucleotide-binding universal stress UspA family protein
LRATFDTALGGVPTDVRVEAWVVEGPVAPALIRYASGEDDLLVVGAGTPQRFWRRGVADACVREATCPVVVVPPPAMARGGDTRTLARQLSREAELFITAL